MYLRSIPQEFCTFIHILLVEMFEIWASLVSLFFYGIKLNKKKQSKLHKEFNKEKKFFWFGAVFTDQNLWCIEDNTKSNLHSNNVGQKIHYWGVCYSAIWHIHSILFLYIIFQSLQTFVGTFHQSSIDALTILFRSLVPKPV